MLHFSEDRLNQAVELLGWSGSQSPVNGHDYLMVVDANLGNKSNHSVLRQLTYDVEVEADGSANSRATVAYDYPASIAENDPAVDPEHHGPIEYRNLLQVFVPPTAVVGEITGLPYAAETIPLPPDYTLLTSQFTVEYDSTQRLQFSYNTPSVVEDLGGYRRYRLLIEKQPGMLPESADVQVALPANAQVVSVSPEADASYTLEQPILEFRLTQIADQWIEVVYQEQ